MGQQIDVREVSGCACLRARRIARELTNLYDTALEPTGLTANQFGLLAKLYGATLADRNSLSIGTLAGILGVHPTTLNRDLKPLQAQRLIAEVVDRADRRVRKVSITRKGRAQLRRAVPFWRSAQRRFEAALGADSMRALNDLFDLTVAKLER